jgi:hypothetical protein
MDVATKQRLVKTNGLRTLESVVTSCVLECLINPIANPNPVCSHSLSRDSMYQTAPRHIQEVRNNQCSNNFKFLEEINILK